MKLYTLAFALMVGAIISIGDNIGNIVLAAGMLLVSGLCVAIAEKAR